MTKEKIIDMAKQAGFDPHDMSSDFTCNLDNIEAFAKLVEKHERIACANIADSYVNGLERNYSEIIAEKIIARGQE